MTLTVQPPPARIGISCGTQMQDTPFGFSSTVYLSMRYAHAVAQAGGLPLVLVPTAAEPEEVAESLDGLILTGGGDLDPAAYGQAPHEQVYGVDPERDRFEFALLAAAEARAIPVLGVCRGLQLINISRGGTLLQHVDDGEVHWQTGPSHEGVHYVAVEGDSWFGSIVGEDDLLVNSYHHQAIDRVGDGLRVVAVADNLPEACESEDGRLLGVQWHPEQMVDHHPRQLALFQGLVDLAREPSMHLTTPDSRRRRVSHV